MAPLANERLPRIGGNAVEGVGLIPTPTPTPTPESGPEPNDEKDPRTSERALKYHTQ